MQNILDQVKAGNRSSNSWVLLLILTSYVIVGLFLFTLISLGVIPAMMSGGLSVFESIQTNPTGYPEARTPLLIMQGLSALGAFIIAPYLFIRFNLYMKFGSFLRFNYIQGCLLTLLILFCFMMVNSVVIQWNAQVQFPDFMSGFEAWAQAQESKLALLTEFLIDFDSTSQFLLALLVIAVLPGLGEELLFRGLIQNLFHKTLKSPHVAIWLTAFLFAAIHTQFYGMVPRMFLGALFGYIYYYSGSLSLAMFAHFLNNALGISLAYAYASGSLSIDPDSPDAVPHWEIILVFAIAGGLALYSLRKFYKTKNGQLAESI